MPVYIALLRAINVGGTAPLKMADLKQSLTALGYDRVSTYLQSGNVVFSAPKAAPAKVATQVAKCIQKDFGISPAVLVLTAKDWQAILSGNPFLREKEVDPKTLHVSLLWDVPTQEGVARLADVKRGPDRYEIRDKLVYLHCPQGYGNSKLANPNLERALKVQATTRNWNTVNALAELSAE